MWKSLFGGTGRGLEIRIKKHRNDVLNQKTSNAMVLYLIKGDTFRTGMKLKFSTQTWRKRRDNWSKHHISSASCHQCITRGFQAALQYSRTNKGRSPETGYLVPDLPIESIVFNFLVLVFHEGRCASKTSLQFWNVFVLTRQDTLYISLIKAMIKQ